MENRLINNNIQARKTDTTINERGRRIKTTTRRQNNSDEGSWFNRRSITKINKIFEAAQQAADEY
ncbi:MAG: hypothetical protein V8R51_01210 [Clostridia bacterium]